MNKDVRLYPCNMDTDATICLEKYNLLSTANINKTRNISVIKSSILSRYVNECSGGKINLDTGALCCKWCLNKWSLGNYSLLLQPNKKPRKELRRLLKKDINSLNKFQQKLVTKVKSSQIKNTLVIKCTICSKDTLISLKMTVIKKEGNEKEKDDIQTSREIIKKKKKKKIAYAGLNPAVVESYKPVKNKSLLRKNIVIKTQPKKLNLKQKLLINKEILSAKLCNKKSSKAAKPSLLSSFLDGMLT